MLLDLKFSIGTLGIGSGAFIAALYGMNLKNFIEESNVGFWGVTGWSMIFAAMVCGYGLTKLRKVQRVSMWGEGGQRGRNWRDEDVVSRELEVGRKERHDRARRLKEDRVAALEDSRLALMQKKQDHVIAAAAAKASASKMARKLV